MKCKLKVATNVTGRSFGYGFASLKYVAWQNGTRKRTKVQAERGASGAQMQLCEVPGMSGQLLSQDIYLIQNKSLETQLADWHLTATQKRKKIYTWNQDFKCHREVLFHSFYKHTPTLLITSLKTLIAFPHNSGCHKRMQNTSIHHCGSYRRPT